MMVTRTTERSETVTRCGGSSGRRAGVPALELCGVQRSFGAGATEVLALRGVDLRAYLGEVVLISGPSGSGKTTLLSIIGCLLRPSAGEVRAMGIDAAGTPESRLPRLRRELVGFVFQGCNLLPALTARENVQVVLEMKGRSASEAKGEAERLLDLVGLADKSAALPKELSGGQKQRVAIARAMAGDPPLLLCDEPTAALDAENGRRIWTLLRSLAHEVGHAVIVVTHDPRAVPYADRVVYLEDGRIVKRTVVVPAAGCRAKSRPEARRFR